MTETSTQDFSSAQKQRPDEILAGVAVAAWQAYNAMETTKRRHFELLEVIDNKKKNYNIDPTQRDQQLLAYLLRDHDEQVKRFTEHSMALKAEEPTAHKQLFEYIGAINSADNDSPVTH